MRLFCGLPCRSTLCPRSCRLDVWNLIPGEGCAELVKAMVKEKIQVTTRRRTCAASRIFGTRLCWYSSVGAWSHGGGDFVTVPVVIVW